MTIVASAITVGSPSFLTVQYCDNLSSSRATTEKYLGTFGKNWHWHAEHERAGMAPGMAKILGTERAKLLSY